MLDTRCSLLAARRSPLTGHCSLLTTHYCSLLATQLYFLLLAAPSATVHALTQELLELFSPVVPFTCQLPSSVSALADEAGRQLQTLMRKRTFAYDIFCGQHHLPWRASIKQFEVVVTLGTKASSDTAHLCRRFAAVVFEVLTDEASSISQLKLHFNAGIISQGIADEWCSVLSGMDSTASKIGPAATELVLRMPITAARLHKQKAAMAYWCIQLRDGKLPVLDLPLDSHRSAVEVCERSSVQVELPKGTVVQLQALGHKQGCQIFHIVLALWSLLLCRHAGQAEVVVGVSGTDGMSSSVILPMHISVPYNTSFLTLMRAVCEVADSAGSHGQRGLERLVSEAFRGAAVFESAHHPIFQAVLVWGGGIDLHQRGLWGVLALGSSCVDVTLAASAMAGADISGEVEFRCDIFARSSIERLVIRLNELAAAVVTACEHTDMWTLSMMNETERSELLRMSKGAEAQLPTQHVHEMISTQASRHPDAVALECMSSEDEKDVGRWSRVLVDYGTLLSRARLVAARLISHGVGAGILVAVLAVKRAEYFAGVVLQQSSTYSHTPSRCRPHASTTRPQASALT